MLFVFDTVHGSGTISCKYDVIKVKYSSSTAKWVVEICRLLVR